MIESKSCCFITAWESRLASSEAHEPITTALTIMPISSTPSEKSLRVCVPGNESLPMNTTDVQYSACVYCSPKDSSSHTPQMSGVPLAHAGSSCRAGSARYQ